MLNAKVTRHFLPFCYCFILVLVPNSILSSPDNVSVSIGAVWNKQLQDKSVFFSSHCQDFFFSGFNV